MKPVYVDLRCPLSLDHLAHRIRGTAGADMHVTEMLPDRGDWWLARSGGLHSCEWRTTMHSTAPAALAVPK